MASLKIQSFRLLWMSSFASFIAIQMQQVARGWLAFELTGRLTDVGIVTIAWGIPMLLFSLVGGATADRMDKRNLIIASQFGMAVLALATALLIAVDRMNIPILFVMGLLQGTLFAFNGPARSALVPELVGDQHLMSAIAIQNAALNATRIFGPVAAGLLIAWGGVAAAYWVQSSMYVVVLAFMFRLPPSLGHLQGAEERGNVVHEIGLGLRYVARERILLLLLTMAFVPTALGFSYFVLLPGFAVNDLGLSPGAYGTLFTASGIGALIGSLVIASFTESARKALMQTVAGFGYGGALLALGVLSVSFGYTGALAALAILGLFSTSYMTLNNTMVVLYTKEEFYGRVMSIYMLTFSGMTFVAAPMGAVADRIGSTTTFNVLGLAIIAFFVIVVVANPRYVLKRTEAKTWEEHEPPAEPAASRADGARPSADATAAVVSDTVEGGSGGASGS